LKASDERYRAFIANSSEAIWRFELDKPIPVTMPEDQQFEMLYQVGYLAECNDAMARMYGHESSEQLVGARVGELLVKSDPQNIAYLRAFRDAGFRLTDAETREVDRYGNTKYFLNNLIGIVEKERLFEPGEHSATLRNKSVLKTSCVRAKSDCAASRMRRRTHFGRLT
jgi:PAS domain-containing protein